MKLYTVAVLGATGAVGQEMMNLLEERNFPVGKLVPLASARSAGKTLKFRGEDVVIQEACDSAFEGIDIVLGAAENDIAEKFAPAIVKAGAVFVDNSSAFRLNPDVPLIVPEVNPEDAKLHKGIISNPNCSTIITVTAVNALNKLSPIKNMVASTYQAVSGAGVAGMAELKQQLEDLQEDMIDPEDLEESAYEFVLNFRDTGELHNPNLRKKGKLVESCVFTEEKQRAMGLPEGILPVGWWIGFKIEDDAAWEKVKDGTYKMFSVEGKAQRVPVEKAAPEEHEPVVTDVDPDRFDLIKEFDFP